MINRDELTADGHRKYLLVDDLIVDGFLEFIVNNIPYKLVIDYAENIVGYKNTMDKNEWLVKKPFTPFPDECKAAELVINLRELELKLVDMGIIKLEVRE